MSLENLNENQFKFFYEGEIRDLNDAGSILMKRLIEEDLPKRPDFPGGVDPYGELTECLGKSERSIRKWTFNWTKESGAKPTVIDFFNVIYLAKSTRILDFFEKMIVEGTPEEELNKHVDFIMVISKNMREMADKLEAHAIKKSKDV